MGSNLIVRNGSPEELVAFGRLLVDVYARPAGFPTVGEEPGHHEMLAQVARLAEKPAARLLVALTPGRTLVGGVVYFGDLAHYGAGGAAASVRDASGIRLLGVDPGHRTLAAGKALTLACLVLARTRGHSQVILHTTRAMQAAWALYERLGFVRAGEFDFLQQGRPLFGFRLTLGARGQ